ncbi:MAG: DUF2510 domain-containing protein [Actinomycetota bacterium]
MALAETQRNLDLVEPGWYPDPHELHDLRYFDGTDWTSHVTHNGPTPCAGCAGNNGDRRSLGN